MAWVSKSTLLRENNELRQRCNEAHDETNRLLAVLSATNELLLKERESIHGYRHTVSFHDKLLKRIVQETKVDISDLLFDLQAELNQRVDE